jgi:hypothetical protein
MSILRRVFEWYKTNINTVTICLLGSTLVIIMKTVVGVAEGAVVEVAVVVVMMVIRAQK